eukprot:1252755-Alexandrium_andersonii.AAC.1
MRRSWGSPREEQWGLGAAAPSAWEAARSRIELQQNAFLLTLGARRLAPRHWRATLDSRTPEAACNAERPLLRDRLT